MVIVIFNGDTLEMDFEKFSEGISCEETAETVSGICLISKEGSVKTFRICFGGLCLACTGTNGGTAGRLNAKGFLIAGVLEALVSTGFLATEGAGVF